MANTFTKEGAERLFKYALQNDSPPSTFSMILLDQQSDDTEISFGNGYSTGGLNISFDNLVTGIDYAQVEITDATYIADGGIIPRSGLIRQAALIDDDGTILAKFDLEENVTIASNKQLAISNATIRLNHIETDDALFTVNGLKALLEWGFMQQNEPATFYAALLTPDSPRGETLGECEEIPMGNGYAAGGIAVPRSTSGFTDLLTTWNPVNHSELEIASKTFSAAGGQIPRYGFAQKIALTDDNATVDDREVICIFDFDDPVTVTNGKILVVKNAKLWIQEKP